LPDLSVLLFPIVWVMERVLGAYVSVTGSPGLAILLLSATFSLLLFPIQLAARRWERPMAERAKIVNLEIGEARATGLRGEALFNATSKIYERHGYHPIQAGFGGIGLLISLPVLIASISLFHSTPIVVAHGFLWIDDLSQPDALLQLGTFAVNVLPVIMFLVTLLDSMVRFSDDRAARRRFSVISVALFALVYAMPAGLVLYWIGNNLTAMGLWFTGKALARTRQ
jgi:membrane protein insertase Oxa1/YidC/SpoIIIJ